MFGRIIDRLEHKYPPLDDDAHQFYELLEVIDLPYIRELRKQQEPLVKPIQSVVEVHHPHNLAAPGPEEMANTQHTSYAAKPV